MLPSSSLGNHSRARSLLPASMHLSEGDSPSAGRTPVPVLFGEENPKPWDATLPPPALKVPAGFCSPNDELAKPPNVLAPLFPNRLEVSDEMEDMCEGGQRGENVLNYFSTEMAGTSAGCFGRREE